MSKPRSSSVPTTTGRSTTVLSILSSTFDGAFDKGLPPEAGPQHSLYTSRVNILSVALATLVTVGAADAIGAAGAVGTGMDARPAAPPSGPAPLAQVVARIDQLHVRRD